MVKHSSLKEDTIKAKEPITKPRNKKYTKTRPKRREVDKTHRAEEPKWWRKNVLYQACCCQKTRFSIILYLALITFIALLVYAVWKLCEVQFGSKFHNAIQKTEGGPRNHSFTKPWITSSNANLRGDVKNIQQNHAAFTGNSNMRHKVSGDNGKYNRIKNSKWNQQPLINQGGYQTPMPQLNPWSRNYEIPQSIQGDKRYIIPPSPTLFKGEKNFFEGSGGGSLEEWRALRYSLLKNRLQLTTGSSYPTENPYWKAWYMSRFTTKSQHLGRYDPAYGKSDSIYPTHDDSITKPLIRKEPNYSIPQEIVTQPVKNEVSKHSSIEQARPNTTTPSAYTKLLQDLFDKISSLRHKETTNKSLNPKQSLNNSFNGFKMKTFVPATNFHGGGQMLNFSSSSNRNLSALVQTTKRPNPSNFSTSKGATTATISTKPTLPQTTTTGSTTKVMQSTVKSTTAAVTTTVTTQLATTAATTMTLSTPKRLTTRGRKAVNRNEKHLRSSRKHRRKHRNHSKKKYHARKHKRNRGNKKRVVGHKANQANLKNLKESNNHNGYHLEGSDLPMAAAGVTGSANVQQSYQLEVKQGTEVSSESGSGSGDNSGEEALGENTLAGSDIESAKDESEHPKHTYIGLRERLRILKHKKKHTHDRLVNQKLKKSYSNRGNGEEKGSIRDVIVGSNPRKKKKRGKRKHEKKLRGKSKIRSKNHNKNKKHRKKQNNKHKFLNIIKHKLLRVKHKNQIANRLKKVQNKMRLMRKKKEKKSSDHEGNKRNVIRKSNVGPKLLKKSIKRKDAPKHWRKGHLSLAKCAILREFKHGHLIGLNELWKSKGRNTFALTECSKKDKHGLHFKCKRTFFRTKGFMGLKSTKHGRKNKLLLVVCQKRKDLRHVSNEGVTSSKKTTIIYNKKNRMNHENSKKMRKHRHHQRHNYRKERTSVFKKSEIGHHHRSNRKEEHMKKHHKKNHHGKQKRIKKKEEVDDDDDDDDDDVHDDDDDDDDESIESEIEMERGPEEDNSGNEEERVERSTTTTKIKHSKKHRKKSKKGHKKHSRKPAHLKTNQMKNSTYDNNGYRSSKMYTEFVDMMKEMKQEIQNVSFHKNGDVLSRGSVVSRNASNLVRNSSSVTTNVMFNKTLSITSPFGDANKSRADTNHTMTAISSGTIKDMVAELVPAIMKQFQAKPLVLPTTSINRSTTKELLTTKALRRASSTTLVTIKTTETTKQTTPTAQTSTPTTPITKTTTVTTTKAHPTPHPTTVHRKPVTHLKPTEHTSMPKPKTTTTQNLALIIKGLKALGLGAVSENHATGKPSGKGDKLGTPSNPVAKKTATVGPTETIKPKKPQASPPLPPPIPKPAKLHNPFLLNILCFGDSLTAGYHNHGKEFSPYGNHLKQLLSLSSRIPVSTLVKGIVGEMTHKQMVSRLPEILGNNSVFDWVIILGGTNDILHVKNFADDQEFLGQLENVWQPRITKDIEKLHKIAHSYGARTMLLTIPENAIEVWPGYKILMTMRTKINNALRQYVNQNRDKVALCDIAKKLPRHSLAPQQEALFWDDHLHMTPRGYNRMAEEVFKCLKPYIPK